MSQRLQMRKSRFVPWYLERNGFIHLFGRYLLNDCCVLDGILTSACRVLNSIHNHSSLIQLTF